jgi:arylsulfatase A-like enzyme
MMGYRTPNIDRIAKDGAIFTDLYAQQSCTAGRAAFITGQSGLRTGLLKVGAPGAKEGLSDKDPTLAELLKPMGYATGQFGKNHLGDRNEFLPTVHGFDEFFGNLYHLKPGTEINDLVSHEDWVPTLVAAAGEPNINEKLLTGYQAAGKTFKVHLDGYNQRDLLAGTGPTKRKEFFYWTDDGNLAALRYDRWKILFLEQRATGLSVWQDPLVPLRLPKLMDLRADPFERAEADSGDYDRWRVERGFVLIPAQGLVGQHLQTYVAFPPRQKPGSFSLDQVMAKLQEAGNSGKH